MLESDEGVTSRLAFQVSDQTDLINRPNAFKLFPNALLSCLIVQAANEAGLVWVRVPDVFVLKRIPYQSKSSIKAVIHTRV